MEVVAERCCGVAVGHAAGKHQLSSIAVMFLVLEVHDSSWSTVLSPVSHLRFTLFMFQVHFSCKPSGQKNHSRFRATTSSPATTVHPAPGKSPAVS